MPGVFGLSGRETLTGVIDLRSGLGSADADNPLPRTAIASARDNDLVVSADCLLAVRCFVSSSSVMVSLSFGNELRLVHVCGVGHEIPRPLISGTCVVLCRALAVRSRSQHYDLGDCGGAASTTRNGHA